MSKIDNISQDIKDALERKVKDNIKFIEPSGFCKEAKPGSVLDKVEKFLAAVL